MKSIDELLQSEYWIIDILPKQVPKDSDGQFFTVERYLLQKKQIEKIKDRHIGLILKLNCYRDIFLDDENDMNPDPERLEKELKKRYHYVFVDDAMILSEPDDTHMTLFNADEKLLELVRMLCQGEGLYLWRPEQ